MYLLNIYGQQVVVTDDATYTGNGSALLDIHSKDGNLGILIPQVELQSETDNTTISNPANGLLVYHTGGNGLQEGFYFWASSENKWKQLYSGNVPDVPGNVVYWIRPTGEHYIQPEYNSNAKIFDAGQNYAFYYEGTNKHGSFFAGEDVGVIGQRAGTDTTYVPNFDGDEFPFVDVNGDEEITGSDNVTYSGLYGYGNLYVGMTGIATWDAGVRGIGLASDYGTNYAWPVVGVMGEVVYTGSDDYGQQGVYGWNSAPPDTVSYCMGVIGRTSQSGYASGGVVGYYTDAVGDLTEPFTLTYGSYYNYGVIGDSDYGVYAYAQSGSDYGKSILNNAGIVGVCGETEDYTFIVGSGGSFTGTNVAVYGKATSDESGTGAIFENNNGSSAILATSQNGINYKLAGTGEVATFVTNPKTSEQVAMFSSYAPEAFLEDYGTGKLVDGKAHISLDNIFSSNILVDKNHPLKVYIQLEGECNGVYVTNKTQKGFDVIELHNGKSNVSFSWHVVANRTDVKDAKGNIISHISNARYPQISTNYNNIKIHKQEEKPQNRRKNIPVKRER